jgi:hypothetical protein
MQVCVCGCVGGVGVFVSHSMIFLNVTLFVFSSLPHPPGKREPQSFFFFFGVFPVVIVVEVTLQGREREGGRCATRASC